MAYKYTGGKTVTVTVGNLASDTIACAYWYTGAVSPTGASYTIKGLLDDGNNATNTDFSYNTVLKATASSPSSTSVTFKTVDNIYDDTNKRYPKYVLAYVKLLPHFHNSNTFGDVIKTANIEIRQRQNSIACSTTSITDYWNRGNVTQYTVNTGAVNYSPSNAYISTISASSSNSNVASVTSSIANNAQLPITLKSKGTATITLIPGDGAGGTTKTIAVTSKTGVTSMTASYTGNLNTGAATSITVSKSPSNADASSFTISKTSGTATIPSSSSFGGAFSASGTSGSPVITFTSADGLVSKTIKITNYTATVACSGSTPLRGQTFTYTQSGGYGSGTYSFSNCQHYSTGTAKVTANSGTASVTWNPSDGGSARSGSITLGVSTTGINATSYIGNLNTGASTSVSISRTPSNSKVGTFTATVTSGSAIVSSGNYGNTTISNTSGSPVIKFTSGDGFVNKSIKITNYTASVACSGSTPLRGQTFTYTQSGGCGSGTYSFSNCEHYSTGKAKVTANSGTASVTWTPSDGGTARSGSITLGVSTTGLSVTGYTGNLNVGGSTFISVSPTPTNTKIGTFTAAVTSGSATISTSNTNYGPFTIGSTENSPVITFTSGDGLVSKSIKITNYTGAITCTNPSSGAPIYNETFSYAISGNTGSGTWSFSNCVHSSAGTAKVNSKTNGASATVSWIPADGGRTVSGSTTIGNLCNSISFTYNAGTLNVGGSVGVAIYSTPTNPKYNTWTVTKTGNASIIGGITTGTFGANAFSISAGTSTGDSVFTVTSADGNASNSFKITTTKASITCSGTTPVKNQTFSYTKSGGTGNGTWTFSGCKHYSAGTAKVTGTSGTATVTWTPSNGTAQSGSIALGNTATGMYVGSTTVNRGGSVSVSAAIYGPNNSVPKHNYYTMTFSGSASPSGWTSGITAQGTQLFRLTDIITDITLTASHKDDYNNSVSATGTITVKTPSVTVSRNTSASLGNEFTYTVSNHSGTGTWTCTGATTSFVSTGKRKMSANGTATVTWTPADGGGAVSANYSYTTGSSTLSQTAQSGNTYYANGIYWKPYTCSLTNAQNRTITMSVTNGYIGTTATGNQTSITVATGTKVYIRRFSSTSATVTMSASSYLKATSTSYIFYAKPTNVTFSVY